MVVHAAPTVAIRYRRRNTAAVHQEWHVEHLGLQQKIGCRTDLSQTSEQRIHSCNHVTSVGPCVHCGRRGSIQAESGRRTRSRTQWRLLVRKVGYERLEITVSDAQHRCWIGNIWLSLLITAIGRVQLSNNVGDDACHGDHFESHKLFEC